MTRLSFLKGFFWVLGLISIFVFYIIADNKVQKLIDENNKLGDSINVLQKNIDTLKNLLDKTGSGALPDANFDTLLVRVEKNIYLYRFTPKEKNGELYLWDFDDGKTVKDKITEHNFSSGKKTIYNVKLEIVKKGKRNQFIKTIQLPVDKKDSVTNPVKLSIKLDSSSFCKNDKRRYKFRLNPEGGTVSGKGVVMYRGDFYFSPSGKDVNIGSIFFRYKYNQSSADYSVFVKDCSGQEMPEFSLPKYEFCVQDTLKYKFKVKPPGCKIKGSGVILEKGEYYFYPSKSKTGNIILFCEYNGKKTSLKIKVNNCPILKAK